MSISQVSAECALTSFNDYYDAYTVLIRRRNPNIRKLIAKRMAKRSEMKKKQQQQHTTYNALSDICTVHTICTRKLGSIRKK